MLRKDAGILTGNGEDAGENEEALNRVPDAGHCVEVMMAMRASRLLFI